jgi:hypothetical protein
VAIGLFRRFTLILRLPALRKFTLLRTVCKASHSGQIHVFGLIHSQGTAAHRAPETQQPIESKRFASGVGITDVTPPLARRTSKP